MFVITPQLKTKIKQDMVIQPDQRGDHYNTLRGVVKFNKKELHLFYECGRWYKHLETYFKTSYTKTLVKANIGPYKGVFPYEICKRKLIIFSVDFIKPSWRDWFITEE